MDERNDHVTKLMSTLDGQARYAAARVAPLSPVKAVGKDGHVGVGNFRFHPLAIGKDGETRRYLVQFDRTVWRGANQDPTQAWSATVDFQWHPELPMRPDDRTDNPGRFQVLATAPAPTPRTGGGNDADRGRHPFCLGLAGGARSSGHGAGQNASRHADPGRNGESRLMAVSTYAHTPNGIWVPLAGNPMADADAEWSRHPAGGRLQGRQHLHLDRQRQQSGRADPAVADQHRAQLFEAPGRDDRDLADHPDRFSDSYKIRQVRQ
jgi:hypothetical protein